MRFENFNRSPSSSWQSEINFPIREDLKPLESGQGYLLRVAPLNGLAGIADVRRLLGRSSSATIDESDAKQISKWFGASPESLQYALGSTSYLDRAAPTYYGGHKLTKPTFVNRTQPRICPSCLASEAVCRLSWDFAFVTVCHLHRESLLDHCNVCSKAIQWDRPAVDVCKCYAPLQSSKNLHVPHSVEIEFAAWVEIQTKLKSINLEACSEAQSELEGHRPKTALMKMIWPLSLNAGLLICLALGTAAGRAFEMSDKSRRKLDALHRAQVALIVADDLAAQMLQGDYAQMHIGASVAVLDLIGTCISHEFNAADRGFAQSLFVQLTGHYKAQRWSASQVMHFQGRLL